MNPKKIAWIEIAILALVIALFFWWIHPIKVANINDKTTTEGNIQTVFSPISIEAKSAYILDVSTGKVLYEKNEDVQWPLASLTKLMVALTASKLVPDYMLVRITSDDIHEEGDTGLFPDEEWNFKKLMDYSLVVSSNDGIKAIASIAGAELALSSATSSEALFIEQMNKVAHDIGLTETYFLNQSGLDMSATLSGGYGSAKDMALLVNYILKNNPHMLEATTLSKTLISSKNKTHSAINTNKSVENIPNVLASKTGYTQLSGGNVVLAWNVGLDHPIIISVLGSSYDGRFNDLDTLVNATMKYFAK